MRKIFENSMQTSDKFLGNFKEILIENLKSREEILVHREKIGKICVILWVSLEKS